MAVLGRGAVSYERGTPVGFGVQGRLPPEVLEALQHLPRALSD